MGITAIRGFNDILPEDSLLWRRVEGEAFRVFSAYGFSEIKLPVVEKTELFLRSIGEATDIVEKEMYTFADRHGDSITLRPEGTASAVRAYIEHKLYTAPVTRLYYTGPMFRYERPQKGRYRQFYQIGAEVLGDEGPYSDAEALEMLMNFFTAIGLKGVSLQINSLGCPDASCRGAYKARLVDYLHNVKERLCENCTRRLETNPLRALDCKSPGCIEATKDAPSILDSLCPACKEHFDKVRGSLADMGIDAAINPRMVRGLDYYTRTTFEITATGLGSQNAVAAGGRYDSLVEELGGPKTPCFGFAIGMERLILILKEGAEARKAHAVVFIAMGDAARKKSFELVRELRASGAVVLQEFTEGGLKTRMKRADRLGASLVAILGDDELSGGFVTIKDMAKAEQQKVRWADLVSTIKAANA